MINDLQTHNRRPLDIETVELLADIKADLRSRIARRRLRLELIDHETPIDDLIRDVEELKRMVAALTWRTAP